MEPRLPHTLFVGRESTPFVGRETEKMRLLHSWEDARLHHRQLVLLSGEPGIGKTRLATEFAISLYADGANVLFGRCDEELALPYMPFLEALRQHFGSQRSGDYDPPATALMEDLAGLVTGARIAGQTELTPIHLDREDERFRLYDAVDRALIEIAHGKPLLVLLDDLHWADKASLLLLRHLLRSPTPAPILFLGTYRETDLARTHALAEMLGDFRRAPSFIHVHLGGLSSEDTGSLIDDSAGSETPVNFVQAVHAVTEGNPFFIQEVLRHLSETGLFVLQEDGWASAAAIDEMGLPEGIREVIGRRLSHLSEDSNAALSAASVFGRDFDLGPLGEVTGLPVERLLVALEEARAAGLIDESGAVGSYRFGHGLIQEALYAELSAVRRARLHGRIAEVLELGYGSKADDNAVRLANHYLEAGMLSGAHVSKAAHYSRVAAEQAEAATAWAEAANHYDDCLTLMSNSEVALVTGLGQGLDEDEAALQVAFGRCLCNDAQTAAAWQAFMRALAIYRERDDGVGLARAVASLAENDTMWVTGEQRVALADEALAALGDSDLRLRAHLLLMRAGWEFDDASTAAATEAESIVDTMDEPALLGRLVQRQGRVAVIEQRLDDAVSLYRRAHALLERGGESGRAAESLWFAAIWIWWQGQLDEGIAITRDALAYARKFHVRLQELTCLTFLQAAALIRCDFPQFDTILSEAGDGSLGTARLRSARVEMAGDTDEAIKLAPTPEAPRGVGELQLPALLGNLARTSFNAGHDDEARKYLADWEKEFSQLSAYVGPPRLSAIAELDECLPGLGDESMIQPLYDYLKERATLRYSATGARGLDHIRGALALKLGRTDDADAWYRTGLEWATRERCPVEQGRCLQGLAEVAGLRHRRREALRLLDEASVLFEANGAKLYLERVTSARAALMASGRGPIKPLPPAHPDGLSDREVEVLRLVAAGKTNRQIADELVLSIRTVERHISNLYVKIRIHSKAQATDYAHRRGLT